MSTPEEIRSGGYIEVLPNIYSMVPNSIYHSTSGISKTDICNIHESIANYKMSKQFPQKETDPMIKGSAFHDLVLLPDVFNKSYTQGTTNTRTTKKWKDFVKSNPDKVVLTPQTWDDIHFMKDALLKNPVIKDVLLSDTILREVSIWVTHPSTQLSLKIRPDIIVDGVIYDLKSTVSPHSNAFIHSVYKWKYHVQSAYYQDVCSWNGMKIKDFKFLVVGSKPPYLTAIYNLNDELIAEGREFYREALTRYHNYLMTSDKWDGLPYGRETVTL